MFKKHYLIHNQEEELFLISENNQPTYIYPTREFAIQKMKLKNDYINFTLSKFIKKNIGYCYHSSEELKNNPEIQSLIDSLPILHLIKLPSLVSSLNHFYNLTLSDPKLNSTFFIDGQLFTIYADFQVYDSFGRPYGVLLASFDFTQENDEVKYKYWSIIQPHKSLLNNILYHRL